MKLGTYIYFNLDTKNIEFLDKSVSFKNKKIGKITNSYLKDGKIWIEMTINKKNVKEIKHFLK